MLKINLPIFSLSVFGALFLCILAAPTFSQVADPGADYVGAARDLLGTARAGRDQAMQLCQEPDACSADFTNRLLNLQNAINRLDGALGQNPPRVDEVRSAIDDLSAITQAVCSQIGQCAPPSGAAEAGAVSSDKDEAQTLAIQCSECEYNYTSCLNDATSQHRQCSEYYDNLFGCWVRVPFCDESAPYPFDRQAFTAQCQRFIDARFIPRCRCQAPWSERQGGCPSFFETGILCPSCSYQSCSGIPASVSCQRDGGDVPIMNWNYAQCDVCRWSSTGYSTISLTKTLICKKTYTEQIHQCSREYDRCYLRCIS